MTTLPARPQPPTILRRWVGALLIAVRVPRRPRRAASPFHPGLNDTVSLGLEDDGERHLISDALTAAEAAHHHGGRVPTAAG